jgi:5-(carboxyamino)imidazole ribonucleotide mutase
LTHVTAFNNWARLKYRCIFLARRFTHFTSLFTSLFTSSFKAFTMNTSPVIGIVMGSNSDWPIMQKAADILTYFGIPFEAQVVSAHRMPDEMFEYAETARLKGLRAIIAGAGGAAHLPGMLAAKTSLPVLGVPVPSKHLAGLDSLYSIVQMPKGIPVATFAIGEAGAANAALFAVAMLANGDSNLLSKLETYRAAQTDTARAMRLD